MKQLILLTHCFPFYGGEEFLRKEIKYLPEEFDQVVCCPMQAGNETVLSVELPKNAGIIKSDVRRGNLFFCYLKILFTDLFWYEMFSLLRIGKLTFSRIHELLYFISNILPVVEKIKKEVRVGCKDEIFLYSYWFYDTAVAGVLLKRILQRRGIRCRIFSRAHNFDLYEGKEKGGKFYLPLRRFLLKNMDAVYVCSRNGAEYLKRRFPGFSNKIAVSYLGTGDFGRNKTGREPFHILSCSYIKPVKQLDLLVKALAGIEGLPVVWTHIGDGPGREEMKEKAREILGNQVAVVWKGQMNQETLMEFYKETPISVFVNVSRSEGLPVSIMEACSFGIPVIAPDVGGVCEIVRDQWNGSILPPDFTPGQLAERLLAVRSMEVSEYRRLCENARKLWEKEFDAGKVFPAFYRKILAGTFNE